MSWEQGGSADFSLQCKALASADIREMLTISSRITKAEAYKGDLPVARYDIGLQFQELGNFELFQNQPNPFDGVTEIVFNLPEASEATLKVFDTNGDGQISRGELHKIIVGAGGMSEVCAPASIPTAVAPC